MNEKILIKVVKNKDKLIPYIFTKKQILIIQKYIQNKKLENHEKVQLYSSIKKKIEALNLFSEEYYINGEGLIPKRIEKAKQILQELNGKQAFISGSFLYSEKYSDIDIYILSKKRKTETKDDKHYTFITKKNLKNPIFISTMKTSVANFTIKLDNENMRLNLEDIILGYEIAINEILDNDDQKTIKDVIFNYYLSKKIIIDAYTLHKEFIRIKDMKKDDKIKEINDYVKKTMMNFGSKDYIYQKSLLFIKNFKEHAESTKVNENLLIYIDLMKEVKDECRRAKT